MVLIEKDRGFLRDEGGDTIVSDKLYYDEPSDSVRTGQTISNALDIINKDYVDGISGSTMSIINHLSGMFLELSGANADRTINIGSQNFETNGTISGGNILIRGNVSGSAIISGGNIIFSGDINNTSINSILFDSDRRCLVIGEISSYDANRTGNFIIYGTDPQLPGMECFQKSDSPSNGARFEFYRSNATGGAATSGDYVSSIWGNIFDGSTFRKTGGIHIISDGAVSSNNCPIRLEFQTSPNSIINRKVRFVIKSNGDIYNNLDNQKFYSGTGQDVFIEYTGTVWNFDIAAATTEIVFNNSGFDTNFRIEGDTEANLFFCDAGLGFVGIGCNTPTARLEVSGGNIVTNRFVSGAGIFSSQTISGQNIFLLSGMNIYSGSTTNNYINIGRNSAEKFGISVDDNNCIMNFVQDQDEDTIHTWQFDFSGVGAISGANYSFRIQDKEKIKIISGATIFTDKISGSSIVCTGTISGSNISAAIGKITNLGGYAVLMVAGENISGGHVVMASRSYNNYVLKCGTTDGTDGRDMPIGIAESDASSGANVYVITTGIAKIWNDGVNNVTTGDHVITSATISGCTLNSTIPDVPATANHWREAGHAIESISGGALFKAIIHFN